MALKDYLNGPKYRQRVQELESELAQIKERYGQLQVLAKKFGVMEVLEVRELIHQESARLADVRQSIEAAERDVAALSKQTSELRASAGVGNDLAVRKFRTLRAKV